MFTALSRHAKQVVTNQLQFLRSLLSQSRPSLRASLRKQYKEIVQEHLQPGQRDLFIENFFVTPSGILVFFHCTDEDGQIKVYMQLFEGLQINHALFEQPKEIYHIGAKRDGWKFLDLTQDSGRYVAYWSSPSGGTKEIIYPSYVIRSEVQLKHPLPVLFKPNCNPILGPHAHNSWEAFCTFNPAAIYAGDKVHLLYRAQGFDYVSQIGYASSSDGLSIDERHHKPAYRPTQPFEGFNLPVGDPDSPFVSGGGCGGCEDPRATLIDDRIYMTYVAYNGWDHPRIALTSIVVDCVFLLFPHGLRRSIGSSRKRSQRSSRPVLWLDRARLCLYRNHHPDCVFLSSCDSDRANVRCVTDGATLIMSRSKNPFSLYGAKGFSFLQH